MAKINVAHKLPPVHTHEGAPARSITPERQLQRTVMASLLWEDTFYEDGVSVADRVKDLVPKVPAAYVSALAMTARTEMKLRHMPLLIVREMARASEEHRKLVSFTLENVIQRADELAEFLAIYWKDKKQPLSAQVKKGLAAAFKKFDEYALGKYNRDAAVKLRDVLLLCHAKPKDEAQAILWTKLVNNALTPPDTWEVALSAGKNKKETWERLIREGKLGGLAFLRNLRNMQRDGVDESVVFEGLSQMKTDRILPFRFITAARYAPKWEHKLEPVMMRCLEGHAQLPGKTVLLVDTSGSMIAPISGKTEATRVDVAAGLAVLLREICQDIEVLAFSDDVWQAPARRGFALRDAIHQAPSGGTYLGKAVTAANAIKADRLIVITDEQSADAVPNPKAKGYMINVASYKNGVGYGPWTHIDGWSESVIRYIQAFEEEGR